MLAVKNLEVVYQDVILVLRGISFEIPKGEIVSLLGSNGSGKTTALRAITGLLDTQNGDITKGQITVEDQDITNAEPSKIVNLGIAQVLEGRRIFSELTVNENLRLGGFTNDGSVPENTERVFELFPILKKRAKNISGYLSGGEQQMLAIARGLMGLPKLLMVDEPFLGLSPMVTKDLIKIFKDIVETGISILFVEQNVRLALSMATRGFILESGRLVISGDSKDLINSPEVKKIFLGS